MELLKKYKAAKEEVDIEKDSSIREIEVHKESEQFYLFAKDNGEFLGQGITVEAALESVRTRFPGQNFHGHIPAEEAKAMGLTKQA